MTDVKQLAKLLRSFDLSRLEYERDGTRIVLERNVPVVIQPLTGATATAQPDAEPTAAAVSGTHVKSPLIGVAYRAREPGAAPLAEIGQHIKRGDPIAVIEAMKMFSEIPAPCDGIVLEVLFENGELVEFGAPLMTIG